MRSRKPSPKRSPRRIYRIEDLALFVQEPGAAFRIRRRFALKRA